MSPAKVSSSPNLLTTKSADTQPTVTETTLGNNNPVYDATPSAFKPEASVPYMAETNQPQPLQAAVPQPQAVSTPQETTQTVSASNPPVNETKTEEPVRPQQEVRPNDSGNKIDVEQMKAEMKKQVDEAIRQREETMRQQANEQQQQQPQEQYYRQQPPPPSGRPFPPPHGQRPPPHRRP
jgi:hypothetical protein